MIVLSIQDVYVLGEDEGLILKAVEACYDEENECERKPGDKYAAGRILLRWKFFETVGQGALQI